MHAHRSVAKLLLSSALTLSCGWALAADPVDSSESGATDTPPVISSDPVSQFFENTDKDRDDYLSRDEVAASNRLRENWRAYDTTGDNRLGRAEFSAFENGTGVINPEADHAPMGGDDAEQPSPPFQVDEAMDRESGETP